MDDEKLKDIGAGIDEMTDSDITGLLKSSKQFRRLVDMHVTKGIQSYAEKHPPADPVEDKDDDQAQALAEKAAILDRKERIFALALERGIDPKAALSLLGLDDATDDERFDSLDQIRQVAKNEMLRDNGRLPHQGVKLGNGDVTLEQIGAMSEQQQAELSPETVDRAFELHNADKKKGGTLRAQLSGALFGGKG